MHAPDPAKGHHLQLVATDDIGLFVAHIFAHQDKYIGATIEFAADELTEPQIAATFSQVIGRPVKVTPAQLPPGADPSEEQKAMFAFFSGRGYDADIASLRRELPKLQTLEQYLRATGWENAEVVPETAPRAWGA
jgi:uncharacterized protein YbjT (DUF2867 family)